MCSSTRRGRFSSPGFGGFGDSRSWFSSPKTGNPSSGLVVSSVSPQTIPRKSSNHPRRIVRRSASVFWFWKGSGGWILAPAPRDWLENLPQIPVAGRRLPSNHPRKISQTIPGESSAWRTFGVGPGDFIPRGTPALAVGNDCGRHERGAFLTSSRWAHLPGKPATNRLRGRD